MLHSVWSFLVSNGVLHSLVNGVTMFLLGGAVKLLHDLIKHQKRTNDLLDPTTPGGISALVPPDPPKNPLSPE